MAAKKKTAKKKTAKKKTVRKKATKKKTSQKKAEAPAEVVRTGKKRKKKKIKITRSVVGRPPLYESAEEMQRIIDLYFIAIEVNKAKLHYSEIQLDGFNDEDLQVIDAVTEEKPLVSGLAYMLDMTTETFRQYGSTEGTKDSEFSSTVKKAKQRIEKHLESRLDGGNVIGTIFNLKNNFRWKDKFENEHTGPGGGPIQSRQLSRGEWKDVRKKMLEDDDA